MIKRIVKLLVGAFVVISIVVAFTPSITGITTSTLTAGSPAAEILLKICQWLIPLGAALALVLMGIRAFKKR